MGLRYHIIWMIYSQSIVKNYKNIAVQETRVLQSIQRDHIKIKVLTLLCRCKRHYISLLSPFSHVSTGFKKRYLHLSITGWLQPATNAQAVYFSLFVFTL